MSDIKITYRLEKKSELTYQEMDDNFRSIQENALQKKYVDDKFHSPLSNYASDAAAGLDGLTTGDWYQISGVVMIKQ